MRPLKLYTGKNIYTKFYSENYDWERHYLVFAEKKKKIEIKIKQKVVIEK